MPTGTVYSYYTCRKKPTGDGGGGGEDIFFKNPGVIKNIFF